MHSFQPQELQQLYQVELILRLEAPDLGLDTSHIDRYEALFAGKRNSQRNSQHNSQRYSQRNSQCNSQCNSQRNSQRDSQRTVLVC